MAIVPVNLLGFVQAHEGLVNQRRGLQRFSGALTAEVLRRAGPQLVLEDGRHARIRRFVARVPSSQELGDLASR